MFLVLLFFTSFLFINFFSTALTNNVVKRQNIQTALCFIVLFGFMGFRDIPILNDTAHYYAHQQSVISLHRRIIETDDFERFEKGYQIYENLIAWFSDNPYCIICISAFIITFSYLYFIKRHTYDVAYVVFFHICTGFLTIYSGLRQGLASCFFLFAILAMERCKWWLFFTLCGLAFSFHSSAIILFFIPILQRIEINRKNIIWTILIVLFIGMQLEHLLPMLGYSDSRYIETNMSRTTLAFAAIINATTDILVIWVCYYLKSSNKIAITQTDHCLWWLSILSTSFSFLDTQFLIMARFTMYFSICKYIMLLKYMFLARRSQRQFFLIFLGVLFVSRVFIILEYKPEWWHIYPYQFFDFDAPYHNTNTGY